MKYLNAKHNILEWRPAVELKDDLLRRLRMAASYLSAEETHRMYEAFLEKIAEKLQFEATTAAKFHEHLEKVESAPEDELVGLHRQLSSLAIQHFKMNDSGEALLEMCSKYRSALVKRVVTLAEETMAKDGFGAPPVRYAWLETGAAGRQEMATSGDYKALVVYANDGDEASVWMQKFSSLAVDLLEATGIARLGKISPASSTWCKDIGGWRKLMTGGKQLAVESMVSCLDTRYLHGDQAVAAEFTNLVHSVVHARSDLMWSEARRAARLPLATGLLGWFRVERTGAHRGEVNLHGYAYLPLVALIRVMAAVAGIQATNTAERIKQLLKKGKLSVDMSEELLQAYHVINRQRIPLQMGEVSSSAPGYVDPEYLTEEEEQTLKNSLEAVANLQKLVYAVMAEKW